MSFRIPPISFIALLVAWGFSIAGAAPRDEYETLKKLHETHQPPTGETSSKAKTDWLEHQSRTLRERGLEFISTYSDNPLRWDVLVLMRRGYNPSTAEQLARWNQKYYPMLEDLLEARDASRAARHEALAQLIDYYCEAVRHDVIDNPKKGVVPALLEWVDELGAMDRGSGKLAFIYLRVARMLNALDPARCRAFVEEKYALYPVKTRSHSDSFMRQRLEKFQRLLRNQDQPATELWSYLAKIDPAVADPSRYRDKVVLVVYVSVDAYRARQLAEIHRKYHDAGLEIIQIAYLNRSTTASLAQRDKSAMERYVAEKKWTWPVLWEVAKSREEFYAEWGGDTIPCVLIVGRDGRIAREIPGEVDWDVMVRRELLRTATIR
ncbi:MAG: hypothetical protein V4773_02730 [Verrucomicrobiota bacterium]